MYSIQKIADYLDAKIIGDSNLIIKGLCGIDSGKEQYIAYIHEEQYFKYFTTTKASAVIIDNQYNFPKTNKTLIKVSNSANAFSKLINLFHNEIAHKESISKSAIINNNVKLGKNIYIGHNVVIESNVSIGKKNF